MMIEPHGGKLVEKVVTPERKEVMLEQFGEMPILDITRAHAVDLQNISLGVYSPLEGFMGHDDLDNVLKEMRLPDDTPWTIPVLLDTDSNAVRDGEEVGLRFMGEPLGIVNIEEIYTYDREEISRMTFGTEDTEHPGVRKVLNLCSKFICGEVLLLQEMYVPFHHYYLKPKELRVLFKEKGWNTVVAFQTRNPPHVGHEYVQKAALTFVDGLLINPVIGKKKAGDFKDEVILRAYEALLSEYYPRDRAVLATLLHDMWYAGPREAIHHAIMRKNLGCTHIIIGRDHAGVGNFYDPYAAHEIFKEFPDLGISPFFFRSFFYCPRCRSPANEKTCPHDVVQKFSGTLVRQIVKEGKIPPAHLVRPEVADVIASFESPFVEV